MNLEKTKKNRLEVPRSLIIIIGILGFGANTFGYMESQLLNTYIDHVLDLEYIFVSIMVSSSAVIGLIFLFVWGIISDNTRSKYGRRRPYLLFGGIVCAIALFSFGLSKN